MLRFSNEPSTHYPRFWGLDRQRHELHPHSERKTAFTKVVEGSGHFHALIAKGKPWRNGFIERSNRTDKEELFDRFRFSSSEERNYYRKLWKYEYNFKRSH